jgi:hypothetical protein
MTTLFSLMTVVSGCSNIPAIESSHPSLLVLCQCQHHQAQWRVGAKHCQVPASASGSSSTAQPVGSMTRCFGPVATSHRAVSTPQSTACSSGIQAHMTCSLSTVSGIRPCFRTVVVADRSGSSVLGAVQGLISPNRSSASTVRPSFTLASVKQSWGKACWQCGAQ